jgi:hypothetical protein
MQRIKRTMIPVRGGSGRGNREQFTSLKATELYCPKCKRATPVRERLLLVLPEGDKYEYLCAYCGTSVGERIVKDQQQPIIIT